MSWAKFSDDAPDSIKLRRAGTQCLALWAAAICWCNKHLTDGVIPKDLIGDVWRPIGEDFDAEAVAAVCVERRLFVEHDDAFEVKDFLEFNMSAEEVRKRRKAAAKRAERARKKRGGVADEAPDDERAAHVTRDVTRDSQRTCDDGAGARTRPRPDPSRPVSPKGEGGTRASAPEPPPPPPVNELERNERELRAAKDAVREAWKAWEKRAGGLTPRAQQRHLNDVAVWLADYRKRHPDRSLDDLAVTMVTGFLTLKRRRDPPAEWLAEDPGRYLEHADDLAQAHRKRTESESRERAEARRKAAEERALAADPVDAKEAVAKLTGAIGIPLNGRPAKARPGPEDRQRMSREAEEERRREIERQREQLKASGGDA